MLPFEQCLQNKEDQGIISQEKLSFHEVAGFFNWAESENRSPSQEFFTIEESVDVSSAKQPFSHRKIWNSMMK